MKFGKSFVSGLLVVATFTFANGTSVAADAPGMDKAITEEELSALNLAQKEALKNSVDISHSYVIISHEDKNIIFVRFLRNIYEDHGWTVKTHGSAACSLFKIASETATELSCGEK